MDKELLGEIDKVKVKFKRTLNDLFSDGWRLFDDHCPDMRKKGGNNEN